MFKTCLGYLKPCLKKKKRISSSLGIRGPYKLKEGKENEIQLVKMFALKPSGGEMHSQQSLSRSNSLVLERFLLCLVLRYFWQSGGDAKMASLKGVPFFSLGRMQTLTPALWLRSHSVELKG